MNSQTRSQHQEDAAYAAAAARRIVDRQDPLGFERDRASDFTLAIAYQAAAARYYAAQAAA